MATMHRKMNQLPRRLVLDATGRVIGRVQAALVDLETWAVDTLRVTVARRAAPDLDMTWVWWSFWRRPFLDVPTGLIQAAGDAIILRVSLAELRESPPQPVHEPAVVWPFRSAA
jgi:sporulation protein YlmC with PRC-barrel domain